MDAGLAAQAAWKEQTGCLRLEGESPLLRVGNRCLVKKHPWSGAREAESGSLLRSYTPKGYRGFESPLLRKYGPSDPQSVGLYMEGVLHF